jgi:pyruvate oxidase
LYINFLIAIIFNDRKLKNIKKEQLREGFPEFGVSFPNPNFAEFAITCGGHGIRVEKAEDLDAALREAFDSDKSSIVEVLVDPDKMAAATKSAD